MNRRNRLLVAGVIATAAAWGSFQLMETMEPYSPTSNMLNAGGYLLVALALVLFVMGFVRSER